MPDAPRPAAECKTMSLREYARTVGISYTSAKRLSAQDKIVGQVRFGRRVLVSTAAVDRLLGR
jgi:hypothetical protein